MPTLFPATDMPQEPLQRFYPPQGMQAGNTYPCATPAPASERPVPLRQKKGDAVYFSQRHPVLLQRLYLATDTFLDTYPAQSFLYDAYPDYLSLELMRNRILRENASLTEAFLQAGCPIAWLNLLTDTVISELLCRRRCPQRNPMGDANITSVQSASRS